MQIYYLYLKKLNHIEKQELNFGGEFLFHYDDEQKSLNINRNPFYIPDFFKPSSSNSKFAKVLNVTGIIAENGAGKTTILNVLRENLAKGGGGVKDPMIIIFEHNGQRKICHYDEILIKEGNFVCYGDVDHLIPGQTDQAIS